MPQVYRCVCGYMPITTIEYRSDKAHYLTKCKNCQIVYVNGPSETWGHSIEMWNSFVREFIRILVSKSIELIPELKEDLRKFCV